MAVKSGYKQTEVGIIPEDWDASKLGRLAEIRMCKRVFSNQTSQIGDIPFFKIGTFGKEPDAYISYDLYSEFRKKYSFPDKGDVLLSAAGSIGKTVVYDGEPAYFQDSNIVWLKVDSKKISNEYLYYCYQAIKWASPEGSTISRLYNGIIRETLIPLPPTLTEQTAIATALSDADAMIESLEQLIHKKRNIKQGAMQELLTGKKRLPGFSGEWEWKTIQQLEKDGMLQLSRGKVISKVDIEKNAGDYPIYSSSVHNDGLFGRYGGFMFDEELITWSVDGGGHFFYRKHHKFSVTNVCGFMRVDKKLSCAFIAAQLQLLHGSQNYDYMSKAHPSVIRKAYSLGLPSREEQTAIATILSDMDADIAALEEKLNKAKAVKQGMMQELLTGRVRLVRSLHEETVA